MIPEALAAPDAPAATWQRELQQGFRSPEALAAYLGLDPCPAHTRNAFAFRVPRAYAARMRAGDTADPLLRQVWPAPEEAKTVPGFGADPVGDLASRRGQGILHKYNGRALLTVTGACAVHCRYCFRRHFPYAEETPGRTGWRATVAMLRADPGISEVILSGGDPLSLSDDRLSAMAADLATLPALRRLRIHTRQPVVLPARVDDALLAWLAAFPKPVAMVLHVNHAQEIDAALTRACTRLRNAGVHLLNQAVLLQGVNDSTQAQYELSVALFDAGVIPYYLHLLDRVQGAAHFSVAEDRALTIIDELRQQLPGYLVPRLAREDAGEPSKTVIA